MNDSHVLTKSTFMRGLQCGKSLMLDALHDERRDPLGVDARLRMRQGQEVGMLARGRYPGGRVGRIPGASEPSLLRTRQLIEDGAELIYEAAFQHEGVFILVDILVKGEAGWRLIEVKSTTGVEDDHVWDVAVQAYALRGVGLALEGACLLHVNKEYTRQGDLDLQALFTEHSLLEEVGALEPEVERSVAASKSLLACGEVPEQDIGPQCNDPGACDFIGYCWRHLPSPSVFDVCYIGKKAFALYGEGITRIEDIPEDFSLGGRSIFHVRAHKAGKAILERAKLAAFLESLEYPLHHLDFETISLPIPPWDGLSPYTHVPFQYSLHVQREPGAEAAHSGFLGEPGSDPRRGFLESLLPETEAPGSIVVYHKSFEEGVLASLAEQFPEYAEAIGQRIERLVDLRDPFSGRAFWVPEMGGSTSLKAVLPALVPELSYEALEIQDGSHAMAAFLDLAGYAGSDIAVGVRNALWEYCKLDTLAMVKILGVLMGSAPGYCSR